MQRASLFSYALVALFTASLSIPVGIWLPSAISNARAAPAGGGNITLMTQPLADIPGREVRITELDRDPLEANAAHVHPGHHTFGYIVEGTYEFGVNGQPPRTLHAGDVFYEPPGMLHSTSRNASPNSNLKIIVFMVADQSKPSTVTVPVVK
jgi:quercetin dioxygenase-like cupin family protein